MRRLAVVLALVLAHAAPARAAMEVGADAGAFVSTGDRSRTPFGLVGAVIGWRFSEAHWAGVGGRFVFPNGELPILRLQYALDFEVGGMKTTVPVSLGMSPLRVCSLDDCAITGEARTGLGVQAWDDFLAPWITVEVALPFATPSSPMFGVHLSLRWEPTPEAEER